MAQWRRKRGRFVIDLVDRPSAPRIIEFKEPAISPRSLRSTRDIVASSRTMMVAGISLVVVMFGIISGGAVASFTSATSASTPVSTGTVTVALGATGNPTNTLATAATNLAPGDTMQRTFDVVNTGSIDWASLLLTTTAAPSNLLTTDGTNGLRIIIDECSAVWSGGPAPTPYTCSGTLTTRVADRAVLGSNLDLGPTARTAGVTGHYRSTITLATTAPDTMQSLSTTVTYSLAVVQRAATNR